MAVNDTFSVVLRGRLHGQTILQVLHYRETTAGVGNAAVALATAIDGTIPSKLKDALSNEWEHLDVTAQKIHPLPVLTPATVATAAGPGLNAVPSTPSSVAAVITKRTPFAGPGFRGRSYFAGVPTTSETDSELNGVGLIDFGNLGDALIADQTNGAYTWSPCLWNRTLNVATFITGRTVQPVLRNQRRRQVGRGS
jgi:hypothetical protein